MMMLATPSNPTGTSIPFRTGIDHALARELRHNDNRRQNLQAWPVDDDGIYTQLLETDPRAIVIVPSQVLPG